MTAMLELGLRVGTGPVQIKDIAAAHRIPQHYLEQILASLRKAGLVESFRGKQGGYQLASRPDQIRAIDILGCLEGGLSVSNTDSPLAFFFDRLENSIGTSIDVSLDDLINQYRQQQKNLHYSI